MALQDSGSAKEVEQLAKQNDELKERVWQVRQAKDALEADMTKKQVLIVRKHDNSYPQYHDHAKILLKTV